MRKLMEINLNKQRVSIICGSGISTYSLPEPAALGCFENEHVVCLQFHILIEGLIGY